jgi:hypothetical protein
MNGSTWNDEEVAYFKKGCYLVVFLDALIENEEEFHYASLMFVPRNEPITFQVISNFAKQTETFVGEWMFHYCEIKS